MRVAPALLVIAILAGCARAHEGAGETAAQAELHNPASANDGMKLYATNCSSCHQEDGTGVPGAFPPLDGNPHVTGDPARVIAIVKYGQRSRSGAMPGWDGLISDRDIAAIVTYVRSTWHNRASAVSMADVRAAPR